MTKEEIIQAMAIRGYYYDGIDSYDEWVCFNYELGRISFSSWKEVEEWLDGVVWEELA